MSGSSLVLGIDPGEPHADALAALAVLRLDETTATIGLYRPAVAVRKDLLPSVLASDPLLTDPRLRLATVAAPLTPHPLDRKPWKARTVEVRLSRGAFSSSARGPNMTWISGSRSWPRYMQARELLGILQARGFPLFVLPAEAPAAELPLRCAAEVFPKASLAVLVAREMLRTRPAAHEFLGELDDWLFPRLFTAPAAAALPIVTLLQSLATGLRLARETREEAQRIACLRRPLPRRAPLRAFVAAFQGILALRGAACLVGAAGDHEGSILLPAAWHSEWETEWNDPRKAVPELRRVPLGGPPGSSCSWEVAVRPPKTTPSGAQEEVRRMLLALRTAIKLSNRSQRSIETALGMSPGHLTRILEGRIHLRVGHVLGVCEQIGLPPGELFESLFPREGRGQSG